MLCLKTGLVDETKGREEKPKQVPRSGAEEESRWLYVTIGISNLFAMSFNHRPILSLQDTRVKTGLPLYPTVF